MLSSFASANLRLALTQSDCGVTIARSWSITVCRAVGLYQDDQCWEGLCLFFLVVIPQMWRQMLLSATRQASFAASSAERLHSMDDNCLESLVKGLHAAVDGDLTVPAVPVTKPMDDQLPMIPSWLSSRSTSIRCSGRRRPRLRAITRCASSSAAALGDQSCLGPLGERLHSLSDVCLTGLGEGLKAAARRRSDR